MNVSKNPYMLHVCICLLMVQNNQTILPMFKEKWISFKKFQKTFEIFIDLMNHLGIFN